MKRTALIKKKTKGQENVKRHKTSKRKVEAEEASPPAGSSLDNVVDALSANKVSKAKRQKKVKANNL